MLKPPPDVLFLLDARIDSGRAKGAAQLNKDIRVLEKARAEIERLRADLAAASHDIEALARRAVSEESELARGICEKCGHKGKPRAGT